MYPSWLSEASFYAMLVHLDADLGEQVRVSGCGCGGVLHRASYPRKPRGGPVGLGPEYERRLSFCCARHGCRHRATPPSLRFLGRRVYLGAVVVLVTALHHGVTGRRAAELREVVGVSLRTLKRWRRWWLEEFSRTRFWRAERARFAAPLEGGGLPAALVERFAAARAPEGLGRLLAFLSPLTTSSSRATSPMDA